MNNPSSLSDIEFDRQHIWHPYTSMKDPLPCYGVSKAEGVVLEFEDGRKAIDGMASWWSVIHGYNNPKLNQAVTEQLGAMSHVMFGGLTHKPAIDLCRTLVDITPEGLEKVFLADSGSVAVEVALKMAIQCQLGRGFRDRNRFVALKHGYHGDTFGAMGVCDPENSMHSLYAGMMPDNLFIKAPTSKPGESFDIQDMAELEITFKTHHKQIAAIILEPVVQGAGGMRFYHPEFLLHARALCDEYGVLLIADEIATGFARTGKLFASEHAGITPDILCLGKALTGGYMTLAATLCTEQVALDISECDAGVLMHGPTFMANPLACAAANASLSLLLRSDWQANITRIEAALNQGLAPCQSLAGVADVRVFGAIGVVEMKQAVNVAQIQEAFIQQGVWLRPFGKLVYVMPQYVISDKELETLTRAICHVLRDNDYL